MAYLPSEGYIALNKGQNAGYYNIKGNEIVTVGTFAEARPVHNGLAWVKDKKTGLRGVIKFPRTWWEIYKEKLNEYYNSNEYNDDGSSFGSGSMFDLCDIDGNGMDAKQKAVLQEIEIVAELTRKYIMENSITAQNQDEYNEHYNALVERYNKEKAKSLSLQKQKEERLAKRDLIGGFMIELSKRKELLTEFDENLWVSIIDKATVFHDGRVIFEFKDGTKIEV